MPYSGMALIRPALPADLDALCAIETRAFATDRLSRRSFRRLLASPTAVVLAAEAGGKVVGYALGLVRRGDAQMRLYSIAVDARSGRRGVGRALLAAIEAAARRRGCVSLRLEVHEANARAAALYERAGYRAFGRRESYYGDGAAALRYEKALASRATR